MSETAEKDGLTLPAKSGDEPRENLLLLDEVHVMEDRIDITSLEIEDLQDACAALAGEINSLRGRLDRSGIFENAKDLRNEMSARLSIDTAKSPGPEGESSGTKPDETEASPGSGETAGADQAQEPEKEKEGSSKKHRKRKEPGVLDFQPEIAAVQDSSRWEATTGENVLDPFAPSEEEDKRKPKPERKRKRKKKNSADENSKDTPSDSDVKTDSPEEAPQDETAGGAVSGPGSSETESSGTDTPEKDSEAPETSAQEASAQEASEQEASAQEQPKPEPPEKEKKGFRFWKRKKKSDEGSDKVYCPECGAFVGGESVCGNCGAKVK